MTVIARNGTSRAWGRSENRTAEITSPFAGFLRRPQARYAGDGIISASNRLAKPLRGCEYDRGFPPIDALVRLAGVIGVSVARFAERVEDPADDEPEPARRSYSCGAGAEEPALPAEEERGKSCLRDYRAVTLETA
jgi:hypothetical protein